MHYNPDTGNVIGSTERVNFVAKIETTVDGIIITRLSVTSKDVTRDINYPVLQSVNLTEIRDTFRTWYMENL